jgi:hypothetical protein
MIKIGLFGIIRQSINLKPVIIHSAPGEAITAIGRTYNVSQSTISRL